MQIFRGFLAIAWLAMTWVSIQAVATMGAHTAGDVFFGDMAHPWRAQFNTDFGVHLLLMAGWIAYREKSLVRGIPFGLLAILLGGVFSFAYLFLATFAARGDWKVLLLGRRAVPTWPA